MDVKHDRKKMSFFSFSWFLQAAGMTAADCNGTIRAQLFCFHGKYEPQQ